MNPFMKNTIFIIIIVGLFLIQPAKCSPISRIHDPVIIQGQKTTAYLDQDIKLLRLFRYIKSENIWEPVRFQVDELDESDDYLGQKDGLLSPKDEIVFMARDLGDIASDDVWPEDGESRQQNRYQIRISDPIQLGEAGYVYLFLSSSLEKSNTSYFNISVPEDRVSTPSYTITHGEHGFQSGLFLHKSAGGDSLNIIERQKFRVIGKVFYINEDIGIKEEMDGSIDILGSP